MIPRTWSWDPVALAAAGVAVALCAQALVRLCRRNPRLASVGLTFASDPTLGVAAALLLWSHVETLERKLAT